MKSQQKSSQKASLVFFGSGPLAAKSLEFLHHHFKIEAVITKPRAPHHKGTVPVIAYCEAHNLPYEAPSNKDELSALFKTASYTSELGVVIDYGIIINRDVIDYFPLGIVNSHFSLLPEWRGADPITFAVLSGQQETGVSLMLINEAMDEGPLLAQASQPITNETTSVSLTQELIDLSNSMLFELLPLYSRGEIQPVPQSSGINGDKQPSYSRKLTKADAQIDWQKSATQIEREIRAFIEWPRSKTKLGDVEVIITKAHSVPSTMSEAPGHIELLKDPDVIMVNTSAGYLYIDRLKPVGKKEMSADEFIRGYGSRIQ